MIFQDLHKIWNHLRNRNWNIRRKIRRKIRVGIGVGAGIRAGLQNISRKRVGIDIVVSE